MIRTIVHCQNPLKSQITKITQKVALHFTPRQLLMYDWLRSTKKDALRLVQRHALIGRNFLTKGPRISLYKTPKSAAGPLDSN